MPGASENPRASTLWRTKASSESRLLRRGHQKAPPVGVVLPLRASPSEEHSIRSDKDGIDYLYNGLLHSGGGSEAAIIAKVPRCSKTRKSRGDRSALEADLKTLYLKKAKTTFSAIIESAQQGEPTIVTKHGRPAAMIVPVAEGRKLFPDDRPSFAELLLSIPHKLEIERDRSSSSEIAL